MRSCSANTAYFYGEYHHNVLGVSYRLAVDFYKNAFGLSACRELMRRRGRSRRNSLLTALDFPSAKATLEQLHTMGIRPR
jgi:hypothetical protein